MALGDDDQWILPENLKRAEASEVNRAEAGEDVSNGDFGSYHALLKGTHPEWVAIHAVIDPLYLASYARQVARVAGQAAPAAVVDVGCGPGALTDALRTAWPGSRVTGIELSRSAVEYARGRYPECRFVNAAVDEALVLEERFDVVHGREFYPFTRTRDAEFHRRYLSILAGYLKPKGVLVLGLVDGEKSLASTWVEHADWLPTVGISPLERVALAHPKAERLLPLGLARLSSRAANRLLGRPEFRLYVARSLK